MLKLERPLVFFDLETTGVSVAQDRIVQMAAIKVWPDGKEEEFEWMVNPGCSIPEDASAVHGIRDEDVMFSPPFSEIASEILSLFKGSDLGGYNAAKYDVPLIANEFKRVGMELNLKDIHIADSFEVFKVMEAKTLANAYKFYCNETLAGAHSALPDTRAALEVLKAQVSRYEELPNAVESLVKYCREKQIKGNAFDKDGRLAWVKDELAINFGKHKGTTLKSLVKTERGYLEWIVSQDFNDDVKNAIKNALQGDFLQKKSAQKATA